MILQFDSFTGSERSFYVRKLAENESNGRDLKMLEELAMVKTRRFTIRVAVFRVLSKAKQMKVAE